ncbi:retinal guanylyl cyclase 1 [Ostrinia nubilalis]|uniref:retinal guanylyl cyclase 1 n=1 Tax=Ostrinia nubilalis TaxID=29057 RepID=UPI0030823E05
MRAARQTITENEFKDKRSADTEDSLERRTPLVASIPSIPLGTLETLVLKLNETFRDRTLILSSQDLEFEPSAASMIEEAYDSILDSLEQDSINQTSNGAFFLYEIMPKADETHWQKIATLTTVSHASLGAAGWATRAALTNASGRFERWSSERPAEGGEASSVSVPVLIACISLALGAAGALGLGTRCAATRRRRRRRRGDAVLAAADFCFPADERRRVGEGMETMLSCWLQQLHEFGGPELERPDLLKQPAPAPAPSAPSAPSSTTSINRVALDRRTRYKGDAVHMKYLPTNAPLELKRKATDVLLVMQSLRHENLNPFIGCLCELRPALVFDHCGRGSLEDVLMLDEIKLDWTFRLSLLTDLVKGMRYLHASPLRAHGRLSSRNCVVDARWVLRVSDYGLPALARAQGLPLAARAPRELLWTAPELLREARAAAGAGGAEGAGAGRGSPAGDVFSFAIIMQEVIVRGEPYCMLSLTPEEIIEKLMRPPPLIRPSVSMGAAPPEAVSVMRQCWAEAPELRPDFGRLHDIFRHLHKGRKINIVDSMFEMLEKYSNNLEDLIRERTEQLDMEKKKTEQLLNRMLPRSVAERLLLGSRVEPEEFEDVSIYFSDIVGFTELAARSTPVQVVDLLNDLYTAFDATIERYAVYKVETIGDAYMVVGGLPVRARGHAESVATMALHLLHVAGRFRVRHLPATPLRLRAGLHSGPVCAAVVGLTMPRYCLFGDTVNTASRMESTGAAWRIQVSAATAERLAAAGGYRLRSRGLTQVKGKGAMHTYWLLGKDGFDKPLPVPPPLENGEEVLFETDGENESKPSPPPASPRAPAVERQRSDPCSTPDKFAWQRSGAVSADSSPPRARVVAADHSAPYARYKCLAPGARVLRRQWSLERDAPEPAADERAPAKYRTRPEPAPDAPP